MQIPLFVSTVNHNLSKQSGITGKDVTILQNLLLRSQFVESVETTGSYDRKTSEAVASYQRGNGLPRYSYLRTTSSIAWSGIKPRDNDLKF